MCTNPFTSYLIDCPSFDFAGYLERHRYLLVFILATACRIITQLCILFLLQINSQISYYHAIIAFICAQNKLIKELVGGFEHVYYFSYVKSEFDFRYYFFLSLIYIVKKIFIKPKS